VWTGCADSQLTIRFLRSESYAFSNAERRLITGIAESTFVEVRRILPGAPERIEIAVRPEASVTSETGQAATPMPPNGIMWMVDTSRPGGVVAVANEWLRASLFHELHHLARLAAERPQSIVEHAVYEGMATAFERDFADVAPPWGAYPEDIAEWAAELERLPSDALRTHWLFAHPDGRRWIGFKAGTHWVDQARARTGRSAADLVAVPTSEILALSQQDR